MTEAILRLQNISKYYYSDTSVTQALRRVNLEFAPCEFVAITGESGSGKSTLLNMISGLDTFDEGEMYYRDEPTFQYDDQDWEEYRRNRIGFVFQDYSLINHYTALDNVLAALVIQGKDPVASEKEAQHYLEQVGLKEQAAQRASELSSGQKQRLSIARALAKNTEIIVADEPTGNLDSETGEQVIELLGKLSHERLVIMVTHNYEQVEPYVTRRVRLHDGEVVADVPVNVRRDSDDDKGDDDKDGTGDGGTQDSRQEKGDGEKTKKHHVNFFALRNIKMQRGRAMLFFSFYLITALLSFFFIGELLVYADDRITKEYDPEAYLQQNDTRLVVRHPDGSALTKEDQAAISKIKYVTGVDMYDYANDVNYYIEENKDYKLVFKDKEKDTRDSDSEEDDITEAEKLQGVRLLDKSHFMRSSSVLNKKALSAGRLPEQYNEIVLYSADKKKLDKEVECYFSSENLWKEGESCHQKYTVVGLLKEKTEQVYFHPELCQMLTVGLDNIKLTADFAWDIYYKEYFGHFSPCFFLIGDDLEEGEVRVSSNYNTSSTGHGMIPSSAEEAFAGSGLLHITRSEKSYDIAQQDAQMARTEGIITESEYAKRMEKSEKDQKVISIRYTQDFSDQGAEFIEVSRTDYEKLREYYDIGTIQASVYIQNYGKTGKVINALVKKGYDAISTYRVSTTKYVEDKVYKRLEVIGISCMVLFALAILQILIVRSILKIKQKDYGVLRFMGMRMRQLCQITYREMGVHCITAVVAAVIIMLILRLARIPVIYNMMFYYSIWSVLGYVLYNILLMLLTVFLFNRRLKVSM